MSDEPRVRTGATSRRAPRRPRGALAPVATIGASVLLLLVVLAEVWTRHQWFEAMGYSAVLWRRLALQAALFVGFGSVAAALVASSLVVGHRTRPVLVTDLGPMATLRPDLDDGRAARRVALDPLRRLALVVLPAALGVLAGSSAATQWRTAALWWNRRAYGVAAPGLGRDVGFYVFELPWWQLVTDLGLLVLAVSTLAAAATHYAYGGLGVGPGAHSTRAAVVHLSVLLAALAGLQAVRYLLDRHAVLVADGGPVPGLTYTGAHAVLPGKLVLASASVVCAVLFLLAVATRTWRHATVGVVVLAVCGLVVGSVYPALVQWWVVSREPAEREQAYAARAVAATRAAYGLDGVRRARVASGTDAGTAATPSAALPALVPADEIARGLATPTRTSGSSGSSACPVAVPLVVQAAPRGLADADEPSVVAVCGAPEPAAGAGWAQVRRAGASGTGVVVASAARTGADGAVVRLGTVPGLLPSHVGVGGADDLLVDGDDAADRAGVPVDGVAGRLAQAVALQDPQLALATDLPAGTRLVSVRDPRERVARVAPWLTLDRHAYPVVTADRVVWVVDGYTTTEDYPGAGHVDLAVVLREGAGDPTGLTARRLVSGMRNSVKALVDAHDGSVRLFAWDDDPVRDAWSAEFPGTVRPASELPADVRASLLYPHDLFLVQRAVLERYHVDDGRQLLDASAQWSTSTGGAAPAVTATQASGAAGAPAGAATPPASGPVPGGTSLPGVGSGAPAAAVVQGRRTHLLGTFVSADRQWTTALLVATGPREGNGPGTVTILDAAGSPRRTPSPELMSEQVGARIRAGGALADRVATSVAASKGEAPGRGPMVLVPSAQGLLGAQGLTVRSAGGRTTTRGAAVVEAGRVEAGESAAVAVERLRGSGGAALGAGSDLTGSSPALARALDLAESARTEADRATAAGDADRARAALARLAEALAEVRRLTAGAGPTMSTEAS